MGMMFVVQEIPVAGVNSEGDVGRGATAAVCALATSFKTIGPCRQPQAFASAAPMGPHRRDAVIDHRSLAVTDCQTPRSGFIPTFQIMIRPAG